MRTAKLSAKSRERVAGAYAAFCSKRNAPPRISSSLGDPTPCAVVHPRNGLAGRLAEVTWQEESDASSASGMSDLPEGVVGAAESQHFCRSPTSAQPDTQLPQAGLHGLEPDAASEDAAREDEQEQSDHHMSAPFRRSDPEVSEDPTTGPFMSGQHDSSIEQHAQRQDRPSGHEGLEPDSVPADAPSGDLERASGSAQQDVRSTSSADDEGSLAGTPHPHGSPALVADTGNLAEPQPAGEAASSHSLDQQSLFPSQGEEGESVARAPPPPPSASLLDASPLWPPGDAMREPDPGEQEQEPLLHAAPGLPPQPPGLAQPPRTTIESYSISSDTSSSSHDVEVTADEPLGQGASDSKMHPSWVASNGHGRAGVGEGTEADPVVLSSDSGEEGQEDDGTEQGAKRQRTEESPDHGFIKPEKAPPREQPTLAQLLQQCKGAQARPGSLRRPSLPIFESLRRPPSSRERGTGAAHQPGSTAVRQDVPSWMRVRRTIHGASHGPLPGQPESAARTPNNNANQRPHAPPISPFAPSSNARMPVSSQQRFPAATSPPFSGKPFSTFRQAPAQPSAQPLRPTTQQAAAQSGGHAQPGSQGGMPGGVRHREVPGAAQRHPTSVEFIDLDSTSGESEDVSWSEKADAQSRPAVSADGPSPHPTPEPSHHGNASAADAKGGGAEGGHAVSNPLVPAPEPEDMSGLVIERDRSAMAAVEAEEWEQRRLEIERQAELARREKKRRRAESEIAQRSQARLEDHRRLLAAQESEQDERERLRMEIRVLLESRIRFARSAESTLRALSIPMEYDPSTRAPNINKAVRRALRFYHPDRYQSAGLRAQVEAEEMFKLVSRVQNP
ncbi:g100 [Coccomyxa elongata]